MTPQIKQRIEQIRHGEVPEGYKRTKVGIVPEEWENKKLGELFAERNDVNCSNEQLLSITADRGVIPREQIQGKDNSSEDKSKYKHISKGDIGYNTMRMWQGVSALSQYDGIVSPAYTVLKPSAQVNALCFSYLFKLTNMINVFYRHSQGLVDDTRSLKYEWFKNIAVSVPSLPEQEKIAEILQTQDKVIELQQKKIDELKRLKKVYLSKMFPKKGCNVPEIRFPGFTAPWEQRKLGEMGQTYTGLSGKTKGDFGHGQARFVTYMNVFSNPISNPEMTEPIEIDSKQNEVEVGDVFFTTSSETPEEVGMSSVLLEKRGKTYLNSFCFGFRPSERIDSYYLAYMLRSESARAKITLLAQGISRYNISKNKVMEIAVSLPSLDEQKMIGQYFSQLDNLITLHQRKCDEEKQKKKALMQLLLTGIVRVEVKQ